jgi:regulatory protein
MSFPRKEYDSLPPKKYWSLAEAKIKIASFCAYQERSQQEVRERLKERGIHGDAAEELISLMISEGFLNEERFAKAFVRGKFRLKKWGRNKISHELKSKQLSANCIKSGMQEIDHEEYIQTLSELAEKKAITIKDQDPFKRRYKIYQYLLTKGYENDLINMVLDQLIDQKAL